MTDTTKRVDVEEWIAVLRRDADLSRGGLAYLDVVANELAALLQQVAELEAKLSERDAELTRIERENREGWKQATHWRKTTEAAERARDEACGLLMSIRPVLACADTYGACGDLRDLIAAFLAANGERDA